MKIPKRAGGWHSLAYTLRMGRRVGFSSLFKAMRSANACKTCALGMGGQQGGMVNEAGRWPEVCKKSLQAMAGDMQGAIPHGQFFTQFSRDALRSLSSRELEAAGRISCPLLLAAGGQHYQPISWEEAFTRIGSAYRTVKPARSFFYFSGRSSNEAGFLLQLFARILGTNNVNNCSYYCHQASGVGLGRSLGTGTATLNLEDLEHCDLIFLLGGNPASNHPRLMSSLDHIRRRGGKVIVVNPVREQGLINFSIPSRLRSLFFGSSIASSFVQVSIGGDLALLHGIAKALLSHHPDSLAQEFIRDHTEEFAEYQRFITALSWEELVSSAGGSQEEILDLARQYAQAKNAVFAWTMGITHHLHGVANVQSIVNLALLRGMIGRPHAGLLPIRGHSNVQGMGSMAVTPTIKKQVFERLRAQGINPPETPGLDTMGSMEAAHRGEIDLAFCLGGNLFGSNPDMLYARQAMNRIGLVVYLSTALNTGHAHGTGQETIILPVAARDEETQLTTQESMFSLVRVSEGGRPRFSTVKSEVEVIAAIGQQTFGSQGPVNWQAMQEHGTIRRLIADSIPEYDELRRVDSEKREFTVPGRMLHQAKFPRPSGRGLFTIHPLHDNSLEENQLHLMSVRSEGQFNTVVYEEEDRYRGQERRDVLLMNSLDMQRRGLKENQKVTVTSSTGQVSGLLARSFAIREGCVLMYYPEANALISRAVDPESRTPAFKATRVLVTVIL